MAPFDVQTLGQQMLNSGAVSADLSSTVFRQSACTCTWFHKSTRVVDGREEAQVDTDVGFYVEGCKELLVERLYRSCVTALRPGATIARRWC
jgi:hypothetical protein